MDTFDCSQNVTMFEYRAEGETASGVDAYQHWSMEMDARATPNFYATKTGYLIEGWFWGSPAEFQEALTKSSLNENSTLNKTGFETHETSMVSAILHMNPYTNMSHDPEVAFHDKNTDRRSYTKFKSFFLTEALPMDAVNLLVRHLPWYLGGDDVTFEFQSLGGKGSQFSKVGPTETAFSHRNARHCLMLYARAQSYTAGVRALGQMERISNKLAPLLKGRGVYVNHLDSSVISPEDAYYGLHGYPQSNDPDFVNSNIDRLTQVARKYNPQQALTKVQPCCGLATESVPNRGQHAQVWMALLLVTVVSCMLSQRAFLR